MVPWTVPILRVPACDRPRWRRRGDSSHSLQCASTSENILPRPPEIATVLGESIFGHGPGSTSIGKTWWCAPEPATIWESNSGKHRGRIPPVLAGKRMPSGIGPPLLRECIRPCSVFSLVAGWSARVFVVS